MELRRKFGNWLLGKAISSPSFMSFLMGGNNDQYKGHESPEELIAKIKGWAYTCIRLNGTAVAQVPLRLYRKVGSTSGIKGVKGEVKTYPVAANRQKFMRTKLAERASSGDEFEEVTDHPILDLLRQVNPWDNAFDLKDNTARYLDALGAAFWYKERKNGEVVNIWPLMSQYVTIEKGPKNGIKLYKYGKGENKKEFSPRDIVHFRTTSLSNPYVGDSPLFASEISVDLSNAMGIFEINSFKNGTAPSAVMTVPTDSTLNPDERKRIERKLKTKLAGVKNSGEIAVMSGGAELKPWGFTPKDMNYLEGRNATIEEICGAFGVPVSFVRPDDTSRANLWASMFLWMGFTINPKLVMIEQKLNEQFTPEWGDGLYLMFDDARPADPEYRLKELEMHLKTKYSTVNEERAKDGLPPVEWGDTPIQTNEQPSTEESESQAESQPKQTDAVITKKAGPKNELPDPDFMPNIFTNQMTILFARMANEVERNLKNYGPKSVKQLDDPSNEAFAGSVDDIISTIFDKDKWANSISETAMPFVKGLLDMGLVESLEKVNPEAFVNVSSPAVLQALDGRREQIKTVAQTAENEIRQSIADSIGAGESRSQTIKRVRSEFNARYKADRVVRTETIWAHNEGTIQAWKQSGVVRAKRWDTAPDERRCPFCRSMHGKVIPVDGMFFEKGTSMTVTSPESGNPVTLKMDYEDIKHPPLHPACRCSLIPILED